MSFTPGGNLSENYAVTLKDIDGGNFFAHAYETDDGRWFDRAGLPCDKPKILAKQSDTEVDSGSDT